MADAICKPNFFIVGAPKAGTTSLYQYLSQHPDVFMSPNKEPCFLAPDFSSPSYPSSEEAYLQYFRGGKGRRRIGEATTSYLYSKEAAERIQQFAPGSKIIAMLRNPVDLVVSLHAQYLKMGVEDIADLDKALHAEEDRRMGRRLPAGLKLPKEYLLYREVPKYCEQIRRYYRVFGRDNVHTMLFDDFKHDVKGEFARVCNFLEIPVICPSEFTIENPGQTPRSVMLQHILISRLPRAVAPILPIIPPPVRRSLKGMYRYLVRVNLRQGKREMYAATREMLREYYRDEIAELGNMLRRDMTAWLN